MAEPVPSEPDARTDARTHPQTLSRKAARKRQRLAGLAGLVVLSAGALIASAPAGSSAAPPGGTLRISTTGCGTPPAQLPSGPIEFTVTNTSGVFATVYLVSADARLAYAEISWLGPGKTLPLDTTLTGGRYAVRCVFSSGPVATSSPVTVTGSASGAVAGYLPMSDLQLSGPVTAYRAYVQGALPQLLAAARTVDADVAHGNLAAARTDWLTAHLDYERLGAAYNSFGDFDDALNGMANGRPQGVDTPDWTGFFALEYGLWHGWSADRLRATSKQLVSDAAGLIQDFPSEDTDPGTLPLRAHEILENALQFQVNGIADYGSGSTLATVDANIQGTEEVLSVLAPVIRPLDGALLDQLNRQLPALQAEVRATRAPDGSWTPPARLTPAQREHLNGDLGALLEQLAFLPNLLTPRNHA
ncbi:iron uptake system EfeUOB component EfeO/EfeM [Kitasatospora sp. MAP12-15]|uniref:EfeM/EfeO family lipoprotein n=1 Tax=unclassified Kitasatospora TaxID=2633591 RepID=UPI002475D347|nr:EfeM/EfeO family lipoprotein [Kitasatospora sp. MAP12-44]MDH6108753.1 iron uptake system EfeUOB component EfeO/EfeM [Kitasatospora sp. MAP12-44]